MKNAFTVSPMSQKINLKPGETYRGWVMVANPAAATEDFYYKIEVKPYSVLGENYDTDFETESDWSRVVNWITLEDDTGVLKPNDMKKVYFTIDVPESAPGGGQYATFVVSSDAPANNEGGVAIQSVYEMASLLYAEVAGELKHEGKILNNEITVFVASGNPKIFTRFENKGNVHETAEVTITVKNNLNGETVFPKGDEKNTFESVIMPESVRMVSRDLTNLPPLGIFEVTETVSYLGDEMGVTSVIVVCPIWFLALIFATIGSVIGMILYGRYLKHKKLKKFEMDSEKSVEN